MSMSKNSTKDGHPTKSGKESREDLEVIHADLRLELQPVGRLEDEIVWDLAHLHWQKRRMRAARDSD
jgi:hypothetical protein